MPLTSSVDAHQLSGMIFAVSLRLLYVIFQHTLGLLLLMGAPPPADFADDQSPGALSRRSGVLGLVERVRHVSGCC
jgi:hypothetical protein